MKGSDWSTSRDEGGLIDLTTLLTAIGAAASGVAGCVLAWAALVRARHDKDRECEERLKALKAELRELGRR